MNNPGVNPDRRITDADAEIIASHMVDKLFERLSDEKQVDKLLAVWSDRFDKGLGRWVRRAAMLFFGAIGLVIAIKIEAVLAWVRS